MSSFKKFEFDNFIIDEDDPSVEASAEVYDIEAEEVEPLEADEVVTAVFEPQIKTYTQEEFDSAKFIAEQAGYEKGYKAKDCEIEKDVAAVLDQINIKLLDLIAGRDKLQTELEQDFMNLNREVVRKLIPTLNDDQSAEILARFLEENFPQFRSEAKLSFYLHPDVIGKVSEQIARLAHINDFEGKISLHKDPALGLADCRVEWENGGVERNADKILEKVDNLLEEGHTKN